MMMSEARRFTAGFPHQQPGMPPREVLGRRMTSARSIASSITWSEVDDDHSDFASSEFGMDPFLEASFAQANAPGMPLRRQSGALSLTAEEQQMLRMHDNGNVNRPPGMPQRRQSEIKMLAPVTEETLRASTDSAPSRPTRQTSVASKSDFGGHDSHHGNGMSPPRGRAGQAPSAVSSSFSSTGTAEPMPEYLLQGENAQEVWEQKLQELSQQAITFQKIVDIGDRRYHLKTYQQCFIGSEAVDRMLQAGMATSRQEAVELGRNLMKYLGLFAHVTGAHIFKDKYLFYRFQGSTTHKMGSGMGSDTHSHSSSDDSGNTNVNANHHKTSSSSSTASRLLHLIAHPNGHGGGGHSNAWSIAAAQQQRRQAIINEDEPMGDDDGDDESLPLIDR